VDFHPTYAWAVFLDFMRDKSQALPVDGRAPAATALRIWHCSYASLADLERYPELRTLVVATYPDSDLAPLTHLEKLEYLSLLHLPHVHDLSPLSTLKLLRTVRLSTLPSWDSSGKVTIVDSLRPLAELPDLRHLELFGVRPEDRSLRTLEEAPSLVSVRVSKYPKAEMARFYELTGLSDAFAPAPGVADWQ
jgi:hypothetical protein